MVGVSSATPPRSDVRRFSLLRATDDAGGDAERTLHRLEFGAPLDDAGRRFEVTSTELARIERFMVYFPAESMVEVDGLRFFRKLESESESLVVVLASGWAMGPAEFLFAWARSDGAGTLDAGRPLLDAGRMFFFCSASRG